MKLFMDDEQIFLGHKNILFMLKKPRLVKKFSKLLNR
jgi:hypothetical protein